MSLSVMVYQVRDHKRSRVICEAMLAGLKRCGQKAEHRWEDQYRGIEADVAVFYGLEGKLTRVFNEYSALKKAVYIDLGYWGRREGGRWSGYHKLVVNDRHPTKYFQSIKHSSARRDNLGVKLHSWRSGSHILLAGMGDKGAAAEGYAPLQWEHDAIAEIRRHTKRPIVYRAKPSWKGAKPIQGTNWAPPNQELEVFLADCHAVVTHHSNVAIDGLVKGIPAFTWRGVAMPMTSQDLSRIENPLRPEGREQWVNDIAHVQYSVEEMHRGAAWRYLCEEGLV